MHGSECSLYLKRRNTLINRMLILYLFECVSILRCNASFVLSCLHYFFSFVINILHHIKVYETTFDMMEIKNNKFFGNNQNNKLNQELNVKHSMEFQ